MSGDITSGSSAYRVDRLERDVMSVMSDVKQIRADFDLVIRGTMVEMATKMATMQVVIDQMVKNQDDIRASFQTLNDGLKREAEIREQIAQTTQKWFIAFITSILLLAIGSVLNLVRLV